jgi:type IV secretion/conjugal transfer VirB4 family ATPase
MDAISLAIGGAAGAGIGALVSRNREHRSEPATLSDELNWGFLVDDGVILQKDGALLAGFRYRGPDLGSATEAELDALGVQLNDALLPFTDGWMFHVDAIRSPAAPYPASSFPNAVSAWIDAERRAAFGSSRPQFVSEYTLCATYLPPKEVYSRTAAFFVRGASRAIDWEVVLRGFTDAVLMLEQRLAGRLRMERLGSDELMRHLHRCLTTLVHPVKAPPNGAYLSTSLASQELVGGFAPKVGEVHLRLVAITAYPTRSGVGGLDFLNSLAIPYRWSNRFIPVGQHTAQRLIKRQQRKWFMGRRGLGTFVREIAAKDGSSSEWKQRQQEELFYDRDATDMARDAADALAENAASRARFGFATQVVVTGDEDAGRALANARAIRTTLQDHGFTARIETVNAMDAFFGTLPGHGAANLRRPLLNTGNMAALWPITSVWPGLAQNPSQYFPIKSPPLMHVATDGSTPFRLNLHVADVGHTLVVGATGAGKSTLVGLVIAQWQRYPGAKTFVFDVGGSHWLLARASDGQHYDIGRSVGAVEGDRPGGGLFHERATSPSAVAALQPLADVDLPEERAWAAEWLEILIELQGLAMTPTRRLRIDRALTLVGAQPREFRTLTEFTVQVQDRELVDALKPYTLGGAYGSVLDASEDGVRTGAYQVFELKYLMDMDDRILVPALLHLFRRVERQLDGSPALIVIEELWAPLMRTVFANRIKQWLLTLRKQNAAVVLVAHSLTQLEQVQAKQVIIESCPTKILLPNAEAGNTANARLYGDLGLNKHEIAIVARATPKRDYYMRSPLGSRLVTLDLGPVALAFLGTPDGSTMDAVRPRVARLAAREGERWPAAWLEELGVNIPADADETPKRAGTPDSDQRVKEVFDLTASRNGHEVPSYARTNQTS